MIGPAPALDDETTEQALQTLLSDPTAVRRAIVILREELLTATGLEREALTSTIALLTPVVAPAD